MQCSTNNWWDSLASTEHLLLGPFSLPIWGYVLVAFHAAPYGEMNIRQVMARPTVCETMAPNKTNQKKHKVFSRFMAFNYPRP